MKDKLKFASCSWTRMWYITCLLQADSSSNVPTKLPQDVNDDVGDEDSLDSALGSLAK